MSIPEIIDFYGSRQFGVIAVTDHLCEEQTWLGRAARYLEYTLTPETFPIYMDVLKTEAERAWREYEMVVLPGFEISKNSVSNSRSAHILGIGVRDYVRADDDAVTICQNIRKQGAISVAAHPVSSGKMEPQTLYLWDRREELSQYMDAWEVASGKTLFKEVLRSGLPMLANSDLHRPEQLTAWKTQFNCEKHPQAILQAIRDQDIEFTYYTDVIEQPKQDVS